MDGKYNYVGIDQSLISTAVCINGDILLNYCREDDACTKKGGYTKWFKYCEHLIEYRFVEYNKFDTYSDGEITKLTDYDRITDMIASDIMDKIDPDKPTRIAMEGYSYNSTNTMSLIDLISFSTLLRQKLFNQVSQHITIVAPTSLKKHTGELVYDAIKKGKKIEYRNGYGIAAGAFSKFDMMLALVDSKFDTKWIGFLNEIKAEMFESKSIKKPIEDINDAYLLYLIMYNGLI